MLIIRKIWRLGLVTKILDKPMEVKKIIDEYHPVTLHVIDDGMTKFMPASILEEYGYNYDQLISDKYWEKSMHNLACKALSDDDRGKMSAYYGGPMIDHFSEECSVDTNKEICTRLNEGAVVYYEMVGRYKEECIKATPSYLKAGAFPGMDPQFGK